MLPATGLKTCGPDVCSGQGPLPAVGRMDCPQVRGPLSNAQQPVDQVRHIYAVACSQWPPEGHVGHGCCEPSSCTRRGRTSHAFVGRPLGVVKWVELGDGRNRAKIQVCPGVDGWRVLQSTGRQNGTCVIWLDRQQALRCMPRHCREWFSAFGGTAFCHRTNTVTLHPFVSLVCDFPNFDRLPY